jgi:hypothetical protein
MWWSSGYTEDGCLAIDTYGYQIYLWIVWLYWREEICSFMGGILQGIVT